jgi:uncharacterized RDD family membrane protein YckC
MTTARGHRPTSTAYPWHDAAPVTVAGSRPALSGTRAGLITRSLANVVDLVVVVLLVAIGYAAVAATQFLLGPATFRFPAPAPGALLLVGLCVQAVYFTITWAVIQGTYGDRLLTLRVGDHRGARLGWARCAVRAGLCTIFPVGLLWVLFSKGDSSVQDVLLRTSVSYD